MAAAEQCTGWTFNSHSPAVVDSRHFKRGATDVRKMAMMVAVLMLAGCDGGKPATPAQVPSTDSTAEAPTPASQQWTIRVHLKEALSDMAYWLVEHHYPSYVVKVDGREVVMIGPFGSQADAEKAKTEIDAAMVKGHRLSQLEVIAPRS
ncbi:SPOR domain-containing protein [Pseudomonas graminis]|uniref:SPOR domain-containing protein n=1 Tax=Pseudomonas graminis TaxID=158627 RepID=UPI0010614230|nr:hypothetical protein [Pseudomonas graminis]